MVTEFRDMADKTNEFHQFQNTIYLCGIWLVILIALLKKNLVVSSSLWGGADSILFEISLFISSTLGITCGVSGHTLTSFVNVGIIEDRLDFHVTSNNSASGVVYSLDLSRWEYDRDSFGCT